MLLLTNLLRLFRAFVHAAKNCCIKQRKSFKHAAKCLLAIKSAMTTPATVADMLVKNAVIC